MLINRRYRPLAALVTFLTILPTSSNATFSLQPAIGDFNHARAGGSAIANDAVTSYVNPAGMSRLSLSQFAVVGTVYDVSATFENQGSVDALGNPLSGGNGGDGGGTTFVPSLFYVTPFLTDWRFGFSLNSPYGLSTDYGKSWVGRYDAIETSIVTVNLNPSVSYQINSNWSVGGGISFQYADATLSQAIDYGAVCLSVLDPTTCSSLGMPGPQSADGVVELTGDDWSTTFNVGVLFTQDRWRLGLAYRSKTDLDLTGDATFTNPPPAAAFAPAFTNTSITIPLTLPENISLSAYFDVNTKMAVMADIMLTRWSQFDKLVINFGNPAQPTQTIVKDWQDTVRFALGLNYVLDSKWELQGGVAYEQSAIPDATYEPSIPTSDAIWLNLGTRYWHSKESFFDVGLSRIFYKDRKVDLTGAYGETLVGETQSSLYAINVQGNWAF